jgi:putative membrane protein
MKDSDYSLRLLLPLAAGLLILSANAFSASSLGSDDTNFVKTAAKGNLAEIEMGRLAVKKATSPEVKEFGSMMIREHTKANEALSTIAASKGVEMPDSKSLGDDVSMAKLKMLSGKSFDDAYIKAMVDGHKEAAEAYQKESQYSQDPSLKRCAAKTLPTVQGHLAKI